MANTEATEAEKRFRRTRSDHANETAEDYVEAIAEHLAEQGSCRGADLARQFGVSHVTVTKTIARLQTEGLVETEPYGPLNLTEAGAKLAAASQKRHQAVLEFLLAIGVSPETAETDSEGIEHHVSDETLACLAKVVKQYRPSQEQDPAVTDPAEKDSIKLDKASSKPAGKASDKSSGKA